MGMPGIPELLIILVIIVLLFGAKKIPELAKGLGSGIKNFKSAVKDDEEAKQADTQKIENDTVAQTTEAPAEKKQA
jgi:sec-independent protein translocase protein TatA